MSNDEKDIKIEQFPSNSNKSKEDLKPKTGVKKEKRVEKIVQGNVIRKKATVGKKIKEAFIADDTKSVGEFLLYDVVIHKVKCMICDMIGWGGATEMIFFGEKGNRNYKNNSLGRNGPTNYGSYYKTTDGRDRDRIINKQDKRDISQAGRARHDFEEIAFETRGEAEDVLSHLVDLTLNYGMASVADFYDLVGITTNFTDNKYGWTDLRNTSVSRVREGYIINLPRTIAID